MNTLGHALAWGKETLKTAGISSPFLDAELLLMKAAHCSKVELFTKDTQPLSDAAFSKYQTFIDQRKSRIPVQYLLEETEFMGLPFFVAPGVLIPRPDTETLVEKVLEEKAVSSIDKILEIGCGSGCISISLAHYGQIHCTAVDLSETALQITKKNATLLGVSHLLEVKKSDLFENIPPNRQFDAIVSNPPYIREGDIAFLEPEVRDFEPVSALSGGADGLFFYREICKNAKTFLTPGGFVFFEIGWDQREGVARLLEDAGFTHIACGNDLSGKNRVLWAENPN